MLWVWITGLLVLLTDQITKLWAVSALQNGNSIIVIPNIFQLTMTKNQGAAFGVFQGARWIFVIITFGALGLMTSMIEYSKRHNMPEIGRVGLCLVMGGALGNLVDRIVVGHVVDFFYLVAIEFPIFNVADIFITIGGAMILISILFEKKLKARLSI